MKKRHSPSRPSVPRRLKKRLGQYLLTDPRSVHNIVSAIPLGRRVVEIGAGEGALTTALLSAGHRVIAVEMDMDMIERLRRRIDDHRYFRLLAGDFLKLEWNALGEDDEEIIIVGNLPYHLTAPILFKLFDRVRSSGTPLIHSALFTIQQEVGERLVAQAGSKVYGGLTLLTRYHGVPRYLFTIPATCFYPPPQVDGSVVEIIFHRSEQLPPVNYKLFNRIVKVCFMHRRKMMRNSLGSIVGLPEQWRDLDYDFSLRPEQFTFEDFIRLTRDLSR